jgi:predicted DsbA family dithiol-disulfide isomerase
VVASKLVVFADYVCPFCFIAEAALARLRRDGTVSVEPAAFELRPPGTPLSDAAEPWPREEWRRLVEPLAAELGLPLRYPPLATRTRKAHEAAAYAREQGRLELMHTALYRAYWEEGRDIGRIDVLVEIGAAAGLDGLELKVALDIDQWTERVTAEHGRAARLGATGVPAYLLQRPAGSGKDGGELRVGLQLYEELRAWVAPDDI